jgi:hypothetical protein
MSTERREFQVGDSVLIVDEDREGELGTIIAVADNESRYLVVFENGTTMVFTAESLSLRS